MRHKILILAKVQTLATDSEINDANHEWIQFMSKSILNYIEKVHFKFVNNVEVYYYSVFSVVCCFRCSSSFIRTFNQFSFRFALMFESCSFPLFFSSALSVLLQTHTHIPAYTFWNSARSYSTR